MVHTRSRSTSTATNLRTHLTSCLDVDGADRQDLLQPKKNNTHTDIHTYARRVESKKQKTKRRRRTSIVTVFTRAREKERPLDNIMEEKKNKTSLRTINMILRGPVMINLLPSCTFCRIDVVCSAPVCDGNPGELGGAVEYPMHPVCLHVQTAAWIEVTSQGGRVGAVVPWEGGGARINRAVLLLVWWCLLRVR